VKFFRAIKRFFQRFKAQPIPSRTTKPNEIIKEPVLGFVPVFFVLIGHNSYAQGTSFKFGKKQSEWVFNNPVGDKILILMDGLCPKIPVYKLLRPVGTYGHQVRSVANAVKKITNKMRSYGISLHINSGGGLGSENLIAKGTKDVFDNLFADKLSDVLEVALGIPQRRDDGVFEVGDSHNGAGMIKGMRDVNCIDTIVEPVFDHLHEQAEAIAGNPNRYALILTETIIICYLIRGFINKADIIGQLQYWGISQDMPMPKKKL